MKNFIKILSLILAGLMLLGSVACADAGNDDETSADAEVTEASPEEILGFEFQEFDGDINFLSSKSGMWDICDIYTEGDSAEPVEAAIWARNVWVKDTFGTEVKETDAQDIIASARNQFNAGSDDFDVYAAITTSIVNMSMNGWLRDFLAEDIPYINMEKSWWDDKTIDGLSINGKLFFMTGDLFTIDDAVTFILMFNKKLFEDKCGAFESPYTLVDNKEWTLEQFKAMAETTVNDLNGNGQSDYAEDSYGMAGGQELVLAFFYGCGLTTTKADENGQLYFGLDTDKADELLKWENSMLYNQDMTVIFHEVGSHVDCMDSQRCFSESRSLFYGEVLSHVQSLRQYDITFGIIPYPMYNTNQGAYYAYVNSAAHGIAIPVNCGDIEKTGMVLEAMAYKSSLTLTPAFYDINLVAKGLRDEESEPMLNLILANRVYDLGYFFNWGNFADGTLRTVAKKGGGIASSIAKYKKAYDKAMEKALKAIDKAG